MSQTTGIVLSTGILFFTFVVDNYIPPDPLEERKGSFSERSGTVCAASYAPP